MKKTTLGEVIIYRWIQRNHSGDRYEETEKSGYKKATGYDDISAKLLKPVSPKVVTSLTKIISIDC